MIDTQSVITSKAGVQKIGKQVSPELPKVKDASINIRDRLDDILNDEKHNLVRYQIAVDEAIEPGLYKMLNDNKSRIQGAQRRFFEQLFELGEYQADVATKPQIADAVDMFLNYKSQFPYKQ